MQITLVRVGNTLIGRTVSDRWNLSVYGLGTLAYDRNQTAVKKLRRLASADGVNIAVITIPQAAAKLGVAVPAVLTMPTPAELEAFNGLLPACVLAA